MDKLIAMLLTVCLLAVLCACAVQSPAMTDTTAVPTVASATQQTQAPVTTQQQQTETSGTEPCETEPPQPLFTGINHYVMDEAQKYYADEETLAAYPAFVDALLYERPEVVQMMDDYDRNLTLWTMFRSTPYYFLIADNRFTADHTASEITYAYPAQEQAEILAYMDSEYLAILNACITPNMTDTEKVLSLYHYFGSRINYNYDWVEGLNAADDQWLYPEIVVYEALKTNLGVCHSYSYLMRFALQQLDIPCWCMSGDMTDSDGSHMWNAVELDGQTYHIDVTWDSSANDGTVGLQYFGMTDEERMAGGISENYRVFIDMIFNGLPCTSDRFASLRDVTDFRVCGNGVLEVQRGFTPQWERIELP